MQQHIIKAKILVFLIAISSFTESIKAQYTGYLFVTTVQSQTNFNTGILNSNISQAEKVNQLSLGMGIEKSINNNLLLRVSYFDKSVKGYMNRKSLDNNDINKSHFEFNTKVHNINSYLIRKYEFSQFTFMAGIGIGYSVLPLKTANYKIEKYTNDTLVSTLIIEEKSPKQYSYQLHGMLSLYYNINKAFKVGLEIDNLWAYTIEKGTEENMQRLLSYNNNKISEVHQKDFNNNKVFFTQYLLPTIGFSYTLPKKDSKYNKTKSLRSEDYQEYK